VRMRSRYILLSVLIAFVESIYSLDNPFFDFCDLTFYNPCPELSCGCGVVMHTYMCHIVQEVVV
jgi:hypothetical protein